MLKHCKVLLDTNFLLSTVRMKARAFDQIKDKINCDFFIIEGTMKELKELSKNEKIMKEVNVVKQIMKLNNVSEIESKDAVDTELLRKSKDFIIATNDKELRKRIKRFGGRSICIRNNSLISFQN